MLGSQLMIEKNKWEVNVAHQNVIEYRDVLWKQETIIQEPE
jgi:hypothetical protein